MGKLSLLIFSTLILGVFGSWTPLIRSKGAKTPSYIWFPVDTDEGKFVPALLSGGGGNRLTNDDPEAKPWSEIKVYLFTQANPTNAQRLYIDDDASLDNSNFIRGADLIVTSHGFGGDSNGGSGKALREMYIASGRNWNVIAVDWGHYAGAPWYDTAAANCRPVGQFMGRFLEWLVNKGATSLAKIHFIGHSLGAHVAGFAGDELKKRIGAPARITGCDPALPLFGTEGPTGRLDPADAVFVDILHTAGGTLLDGGLGFIDPIGDIDFYPNNGVPPQPGCGVDLVGSCSHGRCYEFLRESLINPSAFRSCKCNSWNHFNGDCGCPSPTTYGHYVDKGARGLYFCKTNGNPPYSQ